MVQEPPESEGESEEVVTIPDDLQFKEFKPYTSLGTVAPRAAPQTRNHIPKQRVMSKPDVVKSITGFHQITTLTVGQLGRNVAHAVVPQHIRTNDSIERKERMALKAGNATIETIRSEYQTPCCALVKRPWPSILTGSSRKTAFDYWT